MYQPLQSTAKHCNTLLHHTAPHYNTPGVRLACTSRCNTLQHTAATHCCNTMQHAWCLLGTHKPIVDATLCNILHNAAATHCTTLQHTWRLLGMCQPLSDATLCNRLHHSAATHCTITATHLVFARHVPATV